MFSPAVPLYTLAAKQALKGCGTPRLGAGISRSQDQPWLGHIIGLCSRQELGSFLHVIPDRTGIFHSGTLRNQIKAGVIKTRDGKSEMLKKEQNLDWRREQCGCGGEQAFL